MRVRRILRGELAGALVDGHEAADVEGGFALVFIAGEDFELGVEHGEFARIGIELHFAEKGHLHAFGEDVGEVAAMKPLADEDGARGIGEAGFEQAQVAAFEAAHFDRRELRR